MLVTFGWRTSRRPSFLKTRPMGYYGFIEFQPYCEGWGWVEVALATLEGLAFETYQVRKAITQENCRPALCRTVRIGVKCFFL